MEHRPKEFFIRRIRKEEPLDKERRHLIWRYNRGGYTEFEPEVVDKMVGVAIEQAATIDPVQKDERKWVYVGDQWWCRRRKKKKKIYYEFARMVAIRNDKDCNIIDGLWDSRRHVTKQPLMEVFSADRSRKGYVVGYNEWEVLVQWVEENPLKRGPPVPVMRLEDIVFRYEEDYMKFRKIFANISSRRGGR